MTRSPRLYFSFRSPYSWMAVERIRREVPDLFDRIDAVPYWDPDPATAQAVRERGAELVYQTMTKAKHLYVLCDTKRAAAALGLPMAWPIDVDPWWELPHLTWLAARRAGVGERCYHALVGARWGEGRDICDTGTVREVLKEAGLDVALQDAPHHPDIRAEGAQCLVQAWQDDVFGVPYLMVGRQRFWGLDRVDLFLLAFRAVTGTPGTRAEVPLPPVPVGAYDRDTAGGCG
jgi:2-hydroxychromene-2-carboxylate isomerase